MCYSCLCLLCLLLNDDPQRMRKNYPSSVHHQCRVHYRNTIAIAESRLFQKICKMHQCDQLQWQSTNRIKEERIIEFRLDLLSIYSTGTWVQYTIVHADLATVHRLHVVVLKPTRMAADLSLSLSLLYVFMHVFMHSLSKLIQEPASSS